MLRTAVLLCGDRDQAEDLLQSTYASVFARWRLVSRAENPVAYARTMMTRLYLAERRRKRVVELPITVDAPGRGEGSDLRLSLLQALDSLAPQDRAVVVLRYWEDLSVTQTAAQLGLSESACRTRSSRALARLRALYPTLADTED
ncbi:SigE family RNA polymerase sigma factor [Nocardioides jishulii]|uniref:SigE family RNA polymerase sigma factor n=2 Tax=Nocardioides jishulii TaxID=2575440 RepID=A0A4U2YV91_9ACTN|nr:SigE family RNA polymerase sigma factor [Nocardioides jishulii]TKI64885.1 SigE family RNA polymerase sigma factor [Nocardioides jishulii]